MVHLNYNDLSGETQQRLLKKSKRDVERLYGDDLKSYASNNQIDYNSLLEEEAIRNLYNYSFIFSI